jgi:hypothetical protein
LLRGRFSLISDPLKVAAFNLEPGVCKVRLQWLLLARFVLMMVVAL